MSLSAAEKRYRRRRYRRNLGTFTCHRCGEFNADAEFYTKCANCREIEREKQAARRHGRPSSLLEMQQASCGPMVHDRDVTRECRDLAVSPMR